MSFCSFCFLLLVSQYNVLTGEVYDASTKEPLQMVNNFIQVLNFSLDSPLSGSSNQARINIKTPHLRR